MAKVTKAQLRKKVVELLELREHYERYKELEQEIKINLVRFGKPEIETELGRVFVSQSERLIIPVEVAIDELGQIGANKIIQIKKSVSNSLFKAFCEAGEIDEGHRDAILERAERKQVTSLYVRPLQ